MIVAEGIYEKSGKKPKNPYIPPKLISGLEGSMKTTDEMFQLILTFLPYEEGDEHISLENINPANAGLNEKPLGSILTLVPDNLFSVPTPIIC